MNIFKTEAEVLDFLAALGMGIYQDYDRTLDLDYWYVATGGRDGRMEYKAASRSACTDWVRIRAEEALLWVEELQALGVALD